MDMTQGWGMDVTQGQGMDMTRGECMDMNWSEGLAICMKCDPVYFQHEYERAGLLSCDVTAASWRSAGQLGQAGPEFHSVFTTHLMLM